MGGKGGSSEASSEAIDYCSEIAACIRVRGSVHVLEIKPMGLQGFGPEFLNGWSCHLLRKGRLWEKHISGGKFRVCSEICSV